jgi:excinuclease ABC subunit A
MKVLEALRDQGNTILIIEHDLQVASRADHLIELGPGAGKEGGRLVAEGSPRSVRETEGSTTGPYLRGTNRKLLSRNRDCGAVENLRLSAANLHNLKSVDLEIPLGRFVCVTGVSGSGKSSLVGGSLIPLLRHHVAANPRWTGDPEIPPKLNALGTLSGYEFLKRVVEVDQSPLGRNSRSNPATVSGIWDEIRRLFAATREARSRGFKTKQFSMNSAEGRCPACRGRGTRKLTIEFLSDIEVNCETCRGNRFNPETLAVRYKGLNVAEVLALSVADSLDFFAAHERIHKVLRTFADVGLGYLPLGQSSRNLSGGEAQRVKLASALVNEEQGGTFYFLDEPTTGLHSADVERLVELLQHLVDRGNTLIAIEHQPYFIGAADWVVELGPGGGPSGGRVIETGPPSRLIDSGTGATAQSLASWISGHESRPA